MSSGAQPRMTLASSLYSRPWNSGWSFNAAYRLRRNSTLLSPQTKLMWGVGLMKLEGSGSRPLSTRCDQN